ncbi:MAG: UDP binding domain-containing protein, partial [Aquiluna sp.]
ARADELGVGQAVDFLADVDAVNLRRRDRVIELARRELGDLTGKKILMLGAAFKPDSDDLRDSPALDVAVRLKALGADVVIHDPISLDGVRAKHPELTAVDDLDTAAASAEIVLVGTEWKQYREIDPKHFGSLVSTNTVVDGRNCLPYHLWQEAGWRVIALGRNLETF